MTMRLPLNLAICALSVLAAQSLVSAALAQAPHYEADVNWPKPLPDRWVTGGLGGVCVDAQDHVLILNRQDIVEGELAKSYALDSDFIDSITAEHVRLYRR